MTQVNNHIDPKVFVGAEITKRLTWPHRNDDFTLECAGHTIGRFHFTIQKYPGFWAWGCHVEAPNSREPDDGRADSPEEAEAEVKAQFSMWLNWALRQKDYVAFPGAHEPRWKYRYPKRNPPLAYLAKIFDTRKR